LSALFSKMLTQKSQKVAKKFYCKECDYECCKGSDYNKHILTRKHLMLTGEVKNADEMSPKLGFTCECGKNFKHKQSLHRHKKSCNKTENECSHKQLETSVEKENTNVRPSQIDTNLVLQLLKENNDFKTLIMEQSQQMKQVQLENNELQKQLLDVVKEGKLGNTIHNTTNNNQRFNLNLFLNEQCKDAMNIEDFIASLELDVQDLTETKRLGFVQGISRIFANKLRQLDMYSRPLHCTDLKRETVYIKEDNQWEKDNSSKDKLRSIVNRVARKNYLQLSKWQEQHPNYMTMDTQESSDFMDITCTALGGKNDDEDIRFRQRIMKNVLKEVTLEKIG